MRLVGQFQVQSEVASGGMGVVYRALDPQTGALVALKLLHSRDRDSRERFAREAAILARLDHPAIVRYVAHGETEDGSPYLAMEWVSGQTLHEALAQRGASIADTIALGRRLAAGLGYAHERGVIHRDIKPANLLLRGAALDTVAILDFGIARAGTAQSSLTETGAMLGTPSYMSPEQARGERQIEASADVFGLGCVLYECATGRMAFEGRHVLALVAKVAMWNPPRLRDIVHDAPAVLDELVARMLAKDPAKRPRDGNEVAAALAGIAAGPGVPRPTVADIPPTLVEDARRLASIVAAAPYDDQAPALAPEVLEAKRAVLTAALSTFGVHFELLADGSIVVVVLGSNPAEVVRRAIGCALAVRAAEPELLVAVKSGPVGSEPAMLAVGSGLVDATVAMLAKEAMAALFAGISGPARPKRGIRLDDTTARLVPASTIVRAGGVAYLP